MTKKELAEMVALEMGVSRRSGEMAVEAVLTIISGQMRQPGREVTLRGFGTFKSKAAPARTGRNPKTGEAIEIPAHHKVTFKPSKGLV